MKLNANLQPEDSLVTSGELSKNYTFNNEYNRGLIRKAMLSANSVGGDQLGSDLSLPTNMTFTGTSTFTGKSIMSNAPEFNDSATFNNPISFFTTQFQQATNLKFAGLWTEIQTQNASNSSSLSFSQGIDNTYDLYLFECNNVRPATDGVNLLLNFSTNFGVSWLTDAYYNFGYAHTYGGGGIFYGATSSNNLEVSVDTGNTSVEVNSSTIYLFNPSHAGEHKMVSYVSTHLAADSNIVTDYGGGKYSNTTAAVNGVRFSMSSGNIASGRFSLYGRII